MTQQFPKYNYFSQLTDQLYFGKYPCQEVLNDLGQLEIGLMINLTSYKENLPEYILPGAVNARCPIPDRRTLTDDQLELLIRYIDIWLNTGHKIYIHCKGGHGRAATVCAAWYKRKYGLDGTITLQIIHQAHQNRLIIKARFRKTGAPQTAAQKAQIIRI